MIFPTVSVFDNTANNTFISPVGGNLETATESMAEYHFRSEATLKKFHLVSRASPGAGTSVTFTVRKNGVDTAFSITESGSSSTSGSDFDSVSFSAGDTCSIGITWSGTPAGTKHRIRCYWQTSNNESFMGGEVDDILGITSYASFAGTGLPNTGVVEFNQEIVIPGSFTVKNLQVDLQTAPGTGSSRTFTVKKNSTGTALATTISDTATSNNNTSDSFTVSPGDAITLEFTFSGSPAATSAEYSIVFVAANKGQFFYANSLDSNTTVAATHRFVAHGIVPFFSVTESVHQELTQEYIKWSAMYAEISSAIPALVTRTCTFRVGAASSAMSVSFTSGSGTILSDTDIVNTIPTNLINFQTTDVGGTGSSPVLHSSVLGEVKRVQDLIMYGGQIPFRRT